MNVTQICALQPGVLVRALISVSGGVCLEDDEIEVELPPGAVARVDRVENLGGRQGWALTLVFDNGIVNVFDEGDDNGAFALELVEDTPALRRERAAFLIAHSPPDYPQAELARDVHSLLHEEAPPPAPEPKPKQAFRVNMRGMCTGVFEVETYTEEDALRLAGVWAHGFADPADLEDYSGGQNWEVEGLE